MADEPKPSNLLELTSRILAAHLAGNPVPLAEVPHLVRLIHAALAPLAYETPSAPMAQPAVAIRRSITPDYIVCLEDGRKLKMLKRHLKTAYGLTPEQYRRKWGLAADYPMVAPNYAAQRSRLAKKIGLGKRRRGRRSSP
jgi:predicted transcriptional regulator